MLRWKHLTPLLILALAAACAPAAPTARAPSASLGGSNAIAAPAETGTAVVTVPVPQPVPASCRITHPQNPVFVPPAPNSPTSPYPTGFWYGSEALWTLLENNGTWWWLPHTDQGYTQKVTFWHKGYNAAAEQQPALTVTGRRLDGDAPPLVASSATNGFEAHLQSFMLVGVEVPTLGCWEITGHYGGHDLSFVVWVAP
jgi:hypothetical protein